MKERRSRAPRVHFQHTSNQRTLCGLDSLTTRAVNDTTCRVCMFHYLAESALWARRFLDDLRGKPAVRPRGRDRMTMSMRLTDEQRERIGAEMRRVFGPIGSLAELQAQAQEHMAFPTHIPLVSLTSLGGELAGPGQGHAVTIPRATAEPVNGVVEGGGARLGRPFTQQAGSKKAIGELLTVTAALLGPVQPVVERSGAPAEPIGVQPGQVAEDAGNAGEISEEALRNFQAPK